MSDEAKNTHGEEFGNPLFLNPNFKVNEASVEEAERYLAELNLVDKALKSYLFTLTELSTSEKEIDDVMAMINALRRHRGVFALIAQANDFVEDDEELVWEPATPIVLP